MAPYSACVSSLPTSQRFCEVLMVTQARRSAGTAPAGASTLRASPGRTHSVATETRTQRAGGRAVAVRAGVAPAEEPARGAGARRAEADPRQRGEDQQRQRRAPQPLR